MSKLDELGHYPEAVADWDRLLELGDKPPLIAHRVLRARALSLAGDYRQATAEMRTLLAEGEPLGQGTVAGPLWWCVMEVYLHATTAVAGDSRRIPAERSALSDDLERSIVALLEKVQAAGLFRIPRNVDYLESSPAYQSLQKRNDFQKVLLDLERTPQETVPQEPRKPDS